MSGRSLDLTAVMFGAGVALGVAAPAVLAAQALDSLGDLTDNTGAVVALALVVVVGLVAGGYAAGRRHADSPLVHGAVASLGAFVVVQALAIAATAASGDDIVWARVPFAAILALLAGMLGALVADRRRTGTS